MMKKRCQLTAFPNLRKRETIMQLKDIAEEMQQRSMAARDWVFQVLRTAIIRGVLPGGMPLRQDEISAQLSVSHIPVREAFRQLDAQGLVRIYPNRGAVVTKLTREELDYAVFHQPNKFMVDKLAEALNVPYEKMPSNIVTYFTSINIKFEKR